MGDIISGAGKLVGDISGGFTQGAGAVSNFQAQLDPAVQQQQRDFANALLLQSQGLGGPNLAQAQMNQAMNQNTSNAAAMAASARGINPALAMRQAQQASAQANQQAAGQAATTAAQQQLATQQLYGSQINNQQAQHLQTQGINAQTAATNARVAGDVAGGLLSGAGAAMAGGKYMGGKVESSISDYFKNPMIAHNGNTVPGSPIVPGDSPVNDTVPAMLSPGEVVIPNSILQGNNPGEEAKKFVEAELSKGKKKDDSNFAEGGFVERYKNVGKGVERADADLEGGYLRDKIQGNLDSAKNFRNLQTPAPLAMDTDLPGGQTLPPIPSTTEGQSVPNATTSNTPTTSAPQNPMSMQAASQLSSLQKGIGLQKQGLMDEARATEDLGKAQAALLESQNKQVAERESLYQQRLSELEAERSSFVKDLQEQKINPNQYMSNLSTAGKISTAIGLILGGIGGGLQGTGKNMALETLNGLINRDIDAQKMEMDKKRNLLSYNMDRMKNLKDAELMTRAMLNDQISNQLKMEAAKSSGPIAKARALQAAGQIDQQNSQIIGQLAMKDALIKQSSQGAVKPEFLINTIVPQHDQKQAREELQKITGFRSASKSIADDFSEASKISDLAAATPFTKSKAQLKTIQAKLYGTARQQMKGQGSLSDQEVEEGVSPFIPQLGDTKDQLREKSKGFVDFLKNNIQQGFPTLTSYGIPIDLGTPGLTTEQQRVLNWAKQNPNRPESKAIVQRLGQR